MEQTSANSVKLHWKAGYRAAIARVNKTRKVQPPPPPQQHAPQRQRTQTRFGRNSAAVAAAENATGLDDLHLKRLAGTQTGRRRRFRKSSAAFALPALGGAAEIRGSDDDDDDEMCSSNLHGAHQKWRSLTYRVLSGRSRLRAAVWFNRCLAVLVILNVAAFIAESVEEIEHAGRQFFYVFEALSSVIFLVEHVARVWSIPESKSYSKYASPNRARLRYSVSLAAILDLASCLPFFIELGMANKDLPTLSWLKAFRMFRISKNEAVFRAFSSVYRVVWYNAEILAVALLMAAMLMVATSTLLWYLQPAKTNSSSIRRIHYAGGRVAEDPPADSQDDFSSIPATFYLAVLMLTGQGTPSGVLPWYTKIIVIITAIFSVPIFVIPAGMLTWGFEAEAERLMRKRRERRRKQKEAAAAGERIVSSSSSSSDNSASDNDASGGGDDDEDDAGGGGGNGVVDGGRADFMMSEEDEDEDVWDEYEAVVLGSDDDDNGGSGATGGDGGVAMAKQDRELLTKSKADGAGDLVLNAPDGTVQLKSASCGADAAVDLCAAADVVVIADAL
eukprot:gene4973-2432_t